MNMMEEINQALSGKGYDDLTKIRWIYLYVCEKFSYDTRFYQAGYDLKKEIYNTKLKIEDVKNFEVTCYTIARFLEDVLKEFGYKCEIKREESTVKNEFIHTYVLVKYKDYYLKLDPTKLHDITRVKINLNTKNFTRALLDKKNGKDMDVYNDLFYDELVDVDQIIKPYFNGLYLRENSFLNITKKKLEEINNYASKNHLFKEEIFFQKLRVIYDMVNSRTDLKSYDDIDFYYSYLLRFSGINEANKEEIQTNSSVNPPYVRPAIFFNKEDGTMKDIINISYIQYDNLSPMFYLISKEGENYKAREIFKDEALDLLSKYKNPKCQYYFEEAAQTLRTEKKNGIIL